MSWTWFDDGYPEDKKIVAAGPLAMALDVAAICWSNRHLTDGYIPRANVEQMVNIQGLSRHGKPITILSVVRTLIRVGRWERVPGGYQIHDFLDYQMSRYEVEARRAQIHDARVLAGRASGEQRRNKRGTKREQKGNKLRTPIPIPIPIPIGSRSVDLVPVNGSTDS